jgi:hypothetical protein
MCWRGSPRQSAAITPPISRAFSASLEQSTGKISATAASRRRNPVHDHVQRREANPRRVLGVLFQDMSLDTSSPENWWPIVRAATSAAKRTESGTPLVGRRWARRSISPKQIGIRDGLRRSVVPQRARVRRASLAMVNRPVKFGCRTHRTNGVADATPRCEWEQPHITCGAPSNETDDVEWCLRFPLLSCSALDEASPWMSDRHPID